MNVDEAKAILRDESGCILRCRERIKELRGHTGSAPDFLVGPVQGGKRSDLVFSAAYQVMRIEEELQACVERIQQYFVFLDTPDQREAFKLRYIDYVGHKDIWGDVALAMRFSPSHVKRLHGQGLILIAEKVSTLGQKLA